MKEEMQSMMQDPAQSKHVQSLSLLVQFLAQRKIDVDYVLATHDLLTKDPSLQTKPDYQIPMTTLVYYYIFEKQYNNLFQLLNSTTNLEFLAIKLLAYLQIYRVDLAEATLESMRKLEEDSCLLTLCQCWLTMHNPKAPIQSYEQLI